MKIRNIVRYEQLRKKSFQSWDNENQEDIISLLYVMQEEYVSTYEVYKSLLLEDKKTFNEESERLLRDIAIMSQFSAECSGKGSGDNFITPIVFSVIAKGINADFVMNCTLSDFTHLIDALENQKKERLEEKRLFTYLTMLPHIDSKKLRNAEKDILTFSWERSVSEEPLKEELDNFFNKKRNG